MISASNNEPDVPSKRMLWPDRDDCMICGLHVEKSGAHYIECLPVDGGYSYRRIHVGCRQDPILNLVRN